MATSAMLADFETNLLPAERCILQHSRCGTQCKLSSKLPSEPAPDIKVRAEFIRFLIMGGDASTHVHEFGLDIKGAWIVGDINLSGCVAERRLFLDCCHLEDGLTFIDACLKTIFIEGCYLARIRGQRSTLESFAVRFGSTVAEAVRLSNITTTGFLSFRDAILHAPHVDPSVLRVSLALETASIGGDLFLNCCAHGHLALEGCHVAKDLILSGGKFYPPPSNDHLYDKVGFAVDLSRIVVGGTLWLAPNVKVCKDPARIFGDLDLRNAKVGGLADCRESLPRYELPEQQEVRPRVWLDGFKFEHLVGEKATDFAVRSAWLEQQPASADGVDFRPQPFEESVAALRRSSHFEAARCIGELQQKRAYHFYMAQRPALRPLIVLLMWAHWWILGFGYRLHRLVCAMAFMWLAFALIYASQRHHFVPVSPAVLLNEKFEGCREKWITCTALSSEYERFNALIYSGDVMLPFVPLAHGKNWMPSWQSWWLRGLVFLQGILGWACGLYVVALVTGAIRRA
ncbi:MAG: hypothetical protein EKK41_19605 [Hyphomicrobiales bacterium]|nr:MAG: hypothetical protein EKK41_19605 [Hyphomicrobiales bacterium]